ncbi:MAG: DNA-binding response regulator [Verrucomicrobia bacterium]|nr:MAG: DNA-binding response regulator [Verrucomicrobiota bacterium]
MTNNRPFIAFVDDEEPIRRAFARLLRSAGLDAETFDSGAEFLKSIDAHRPDCVVLDLQMPQMHGLAVQRQLAKVHAAIPVIILTAHDTPAPREQEVLDHVVTGKLNKQIADDLGVVEKTIKVHRARVMTKMKIQSVAELVRLVERSGIRNQ